jgi:nitrogen fixation NifU-like protein
MSDLSDLYQEVILDHNRRPRNYGVLAGANRTAKGHNPLCGDRLTVFLEMDGDRIADIRFEGSGCAISKASASLMTDAVKGRDLGDALSLFERFQAMVTSPLEVAAGDSTLGKLEVLSGVREFPVRIKCASLAWHTLKAALAASPDAPVTTE